MASTIRSFSAITDWMVGNGEPPEVCSAGWAQAFEASGNSSLRKPSAVIRQKQGESAQRAGRLSIWPVNGGRMLGRVCGLVRNGMSEHASLAMEKLSSDIRAMVSLASIGLLIESTQLGRERMSCGGVSSPGKEPSEAKKLSSSALKDVSDDEAMVESMEDARRSGKAS